MNDFLQQFLVESRELIEQATDDLLALEDRPDAADRIDSAFRAFHTLKGAAGIMDFDPMGRALHAAEDVLSTARAGTVKVTPGLISDCLTCLDQVVQWLDAWEASGDPPADAEAAADAVVRRFEGGPPAPNAPSPPSDESWIEKLQSRGPLAASEAVLAVRYTPARDSFYVGVDPVSALEGLPGLCRLAIEPVGGWPPLAELDAFACQVQILALFSEDSAALQARLEELAHEVEVVRLRDASPAGLTAAGVGLIHAQIAMLVATPDDGIAGRVASAARAAANVMRQAGHRDEANRVEEIARTRASETRALLAALHAFLHGTLTREAVADPAAQESADATLRGLRVDVERVDALVTLAGELTVAKNALGHVAGLAATQADPASLSRLLKVQHAHLDRLVTELQRAVLNMRVLPLRHVFQRFPRLVREMVVTLDKPARLVTEGDATQADKAVVENLFEPLLHVLRNALDHGVETPDERATAGKPPSATIAIRAHRAGDRVVVEVQDDGRGIDVARVREAALSRGLLAPDVLEAMADPEVIGLIFAPGFSTASSVTTLSGRGVGMDAVRSAIDRLGGRVEVESEPGAGALVRFVLPFTLMMSRVMTVEVGGQMFGIPLESVIETVRLPRERILPVGATHAFVLRDRTIPLIDLGQTLGRPAGSLKAEADIVVATASGQIGGLEVDRLGERMDVMLKPLDGLLAGTPGIAGAALLGDGRVLLVLDLQELLL
jgi:two-component system chemotaxis sensor kinase CheA